MHKTRTDTGNFERKIPKNSIPTANRANPHKPPQKAKFRKTAPMLDLKAIPTIPTTPTLTLCVWGGLRAGVDIDFIYIYVYIF